MFRIPLSRDVLYEQIRVLRFQSQGQIAISLVDDGAFDRATKLIPLRLNWFGAARLGALVNACRMPTRESTWLYRDKFRRGHEGCAGDDPLGAFCITLRMSLITRWLTLRGIKTEQQDLMVTPEYANGLNSLASLVTAASAYEVPAARQMAAATKHNQIRQEIQRLEEARGKLLAAMADQIIVRWTTKLSAERQRATNDRTDAAAASQATAADYAAAQQPFVANALVDAEIATYVIHNQVEPAP